MRKSVFTVSLAAALLVTTVPAPLDAQCLPGLCGFSEKGKKGPYLDHRIKEKKLDKLLSKIDDARNKGTLSAGSIDRGELYGAGLSMPETEAALVAMIEQFRPHWPYKQPGPIEVRIVASMSFAPLAHSDNVVVVPMGALIRAESDDEIAWLLAHEFSHYALGHFEKHTKARKREQLLGTAISLLEGGAMVASTKYSFNNNGFQQGKTDQDQLEKLSGTIYHRSEELRLLFALTNDFFQRKHEDQADVAGLDLMLASGFSDQGASTAIEELGYDETHRSDLMAAIADDLKQFGSLEGGRLLLAATDQGISLENQGGNVLANLGKNLAEIGMRNIVKHYSATHRPAEDRRAGVLNYHSSAYPDADFQGTSTQWLDKIRSRPEYIAAARMVEAKRKADRLMGESKLQEAIKVMKPATTRRYGGSPALLNTLARAYEGIGHLKSAQTTYTKALAQKNTSSNQYLAQSPSGFLGHVNLLITVGNFSRANDVIAEGTSRFGDDHLFLPAKIRMAVKKGDTEEVSVLVSRCVDVGDPVLANQCEAALLGPEADVAMAAMTPAEQAKLEESRGRMRQRAQSGGFFQRMKDAVTSVAE